MLKLMPYEPYEIDALESWLDEQARKGCFLSQSHGKWLQFYRDAPRPLRCRIDVKPDPGYREDRVAAFRDMGWEYVCELSPQLDVYTCGDPSVPDLNTDEDTLHSVLDGLLRKKQTANVVAALLLVPYVYFVLVLPVLRSHYTGLYDMLLGGYLFLLPALLLVLVCWLAALIRGFLDARNARRRLMLHRTYHTEKRVKQRQLWAALSLLALAAALCCLFAASRSYSSSTDRYFDPADYPGPTITQVFPDQLPPLPESGPYYLRVHDFAFRSGGLVYDGVSLRQFRSRDGGQQLYVYNMDQMDISFWRRATSGNRPTPTAASPSPCPAGPPPISAAGPPRTARTSTSSSCCWTLARCGASCTPARMTCPPRWTCLQNKRKKNRPGAVLFLISARTSSPPARGQNTQSPFR